MTDLIDFSYWLRAFLGLFVAVSAARSLWETRGRVADAHARLLILGIAVVWAAEGCNRLWYSVWRSTGHAGMIDSPIILVFAICVLFGAAIHLRTFTAMRCGFGAWWRIALGCAAAAAFLTWEF